jgi:hypothetical protein
MWEMWEIKALTGCGTPKREEEVLKSGNTWSVMPAAIAGVIRRL